MTHNDYDGTKGSGEGYKGGVEYASSAAPSVAAVEQEHAGQLSNSSLEQKIQDHQRKRADLSERVEVINGDGSYSVEGFKRITEKYDAALQKAGFQMQKWVPKFAEPVFVYGTNLFKGDARQRLKKDQENLEGYISELEELSNSINSDLYGTSDTFKTNEKGGMNGKIFGLGEKLEKYATLLVDIEKECGETNTLVRDTKEKVRKEKTGKVRDEHLRYFGQLHMDLKTYEKEKDEIASELKGIECAIKRTKNEAQALEALNQKVSKMLRLAREVQHCYDTVPKSSDYTTRVVQLFPEITVYTTKVRELGDEIDKINYEQQKAVEKLPGPNLENPERGILNRPSPFRNTQRENEEGLEESLARAKEIIEDPFGSIFDDSTLH